MWLGLVAKLVEVPEDGGCQASDQAECCNNNGGLFDGHEVLPDLFFFARGAGVDG